jgi:hypothetical protein
MEKMFTVAGTSRRNGTLKFRFSNDMKGRIPMLLRTGHTEIKLVELPAAMTKADAIAFLESYEGEWVTEHNYKGETVTDDAAEAAEDEAATQGPALAVTEAAIAAVLAELTANGRPRNAKGHFVKAEDLRAQAIAQLAAV